ncbi:tetratricopeptide repeat protein [Meridianimarinicoccus roseus]|uniref:tetratricopeptide repeat protein n=1 Tax=Meridianimarinicoccus roseus TaxID=2072018 RepID=UPI0026B22C09
MIRAAALVCGLLLGALPAAAQDRDATLADIRQQITVFEVELQQLRRELSTTGTGMSDGGGAVTGGPIARLDAIEGELRRLTAAVEELDYRIGRVVEDGTNRIDDLKFRLTELEGGDVAQIPPTEPLGGGALPAPVAPVPPPAEAPQLAVGEQADFDAAMVLTEDGTPADALAAFDAFVETYPRSPLAPEAHLFRGDMLVQLGNQAQAGRAYLESYTLAEMTDPGLAAEALFKLGGSLAELGQVPEACVALGQVPARFPGTTAAEQATGALAGLTCP